jgi:hypothetical protein
VITVIHLLVPAKCEEVGMRCLSHRCVKLKTYLRDRRLPLRLTWVLQFFGLLRGVRWFETDVSGLLIGLIFKGQAVQEGSSWNWGHCSDCRGSSPSCLMPAVCGIFSYTCYGRASRSRVLYAVARGCDSQRSAWDPKFDAGVWKLFIRYK